MRQKKRIIDLLKDRISTASTIFEIWNLIEDDLIYLIGIYPAFNSHIEIGCDDVDYYFFSELDVILKKELDDVNFKSQLLNDWEVTFEIEIDFKNDTDYFTQLQTASDLNFKMHEENKVIRIFLNILILGNISHLTSIKQDFILSLINETQENLTLKKKRIKNKNILYLDCLLEEISALMQLKDLTYDEARHEIIFLNKETFKNWTFERIEKLNLDLDELYYQTEM